MPALVLRVRFTSGDHIDVTYDPAEPIQEPDVIDHIMNVLSSDTGVLRCQHGDRLLVLFARGVASVELSPRGAVL
jgi:hypothetical protein